MTQGFDPQANYQALLRHLADDLLKLQSGFLHRGETWYLINIGCKGDMPWLAKTGEFLRHWLRAERKEQARSRAVAPPGVCWLCLAGTAGKPWEDVNQQALWASSPTRAPWANQPALLDLYHSSRQPEAIFHADLFHNFHGGLGMYFVSSSIVECLALIPGSVDRKVEEMAKALEHWAAMPGNRMPHSGKFNKQRVGLTSMQVMPDAHWSKFDDTRVYLSFLHWWLEGHENQINGDPVLSRILVGLQAANRMFRVPYSCGLWLESAEALEVGRLGRVFVKIYAELANLCYDAHRLRFPMVVKMHMCDHTFRRMLHLGRLRWVLNPLSMATQADEATRRKRRLFQHPLTI